MKEMKADVYRKWKWERILPAKEMFYYLFFGLLLFAKGIGLYDGQTSFKLFLMAALLCWVIKMCLTEYTLREGAAVAALVLLGLIVYRSSGEKAALVSVLVVTGMKGIPLKRLFAVGLVIWTGCFAGMLALSLTGVIEPLMLVHNKMGLGHVIRNSLGYTHPNVLHISYVILIAFWFYVLDLKGRRAISAVILAFLGNIYIFLYSLSYTGFVMTAAYLILVSYFTFRRRRTKAEEVIIQCLMPACVLTALFAPLLLKGQAFEIADKIVNWRFRLTRRYLIPENVSLFGTRMAMDRGSVDCSYVYGLIYYGVLLFGLFMLGYFFLIRHLLKEKRGAEVALVLGIVAAGFTEPFQFNFSFKNLILPFLGEYLFWLLRVREERSSIWTRRVWGGLPKWNALLPWPVRTGMAKEKGRYGSAEKRILIAVCIAGALTGGFVGRNIPVKPYVIVNREYSDRVGGRDDYEIFGELPEEIVENSLQIHCEGPETQVYVLEGNTVRMERIRNIVTSAFAGGALAVAVSRGICRYFNDRKNRKRKGEEGK